MNDDNFIQLSSAKRNNAKANQNNENSYSSVTSSIAGDTRLADGSSWSRQASKRQRPNNAKQSDKNRPQSGADLFAPEARRPPIIPSIGHSSSGNTALSRDQGSALVLKTSTPEMPRNPFSRSVSSVAVNHSAKKRNPFFSLDHFAESNEVSSIAELENFSEFTQSPARNANVVSGLHVQAARLGTFVRSASCPSILVSPLPRRKNALKSPISFVARRSKENQSHADYFDSEDSSGDEELPLNSCRSTSSPKSRIESSSIFSLLSVQTFGSFDVNDSEIQNVTEEIAVEAFSAKADLVDETVTKPAELCAPATRSEEHLSEDKMQSVPFFPLDWCVRKSITIISSYPFHWCTKASASEIASQMCTFVESSSSRGTLKILVHQNPDFQSLLYSYVYAMDPLPPAQSQSLAKIFTKKLHCQKTKAKLVLKEAELAEADYFDRLENQWKEAFRSIYFAFKSEKCPYFYYQNSTFIVLFLSQGYSSTGGIQAIMSSASRGIRDALKEEDISFKIMEHSFGNRIVLGANGVKKDEELSIPLEGETEEQILADLYAIDQSSGRTFRYGENIDTPSSGNPPISFEGHSDVHGIFEYLLNWTDPKIENRVKQFPTLNSPSPFLHASLYRAVVTSTEVVSRSQSKAYKLQLSGNILPDALSALMNLAARWQSQQSHEAECSPPLANEGEVILLSGKISIDSESRNLCSVTDTNIVTEATEGRAPITTFSYREGGFIF